MRTLISNTQLFRKSVTCTTQIRIKIIIILLIIYVSLWSLQVVILASAVLAAVSGSPVYPLPGYSAPAYHAPAAYLAHAYHHAPVPYNFEYSVNNPYTYDVKSQHEYSDGNGYVKGSYSLLEADGSTRTVEYTADDYNGFNAVVKNEGGYKAPSYSAPAYSAPAYKAPYSAPAYWWKNFYHLNACVTALRDAFCLL